MGKYVSIKLLTIVALTVLLWSCDEEVEGCLDYRALSVQVGADKSCEDCCQYPALRLQLIPGRLEPDTALLLRRGSILYRGTDSATLNELAFYLHNIELIRSDGSSYLLSDTLSVRTNAASGFEEQQVSLAKLVPTGNSLSTVGRLLEDQEIIAIQAILGLPEEYETLQVDAQYATSKLNGGPDSLLRVFDGQTIASGGFRLLRDTIAFTSKMPTTERISMRWELPQPVDLLQSYNLNVTLVLPVDSLLAVENNQFTAQQFSDKILRPARIISLSLSR